MSSPAQSLSGWLSPCAYLCLTSPVDQSAELYVCFGSLHVASGVPLEYRHGIFLFTTCHRRWTAAFRVRRQAQDLLHCLTHCSAGNRDLFLSGIWGVTPGTPHMQAGNGIEASEARRSKEEAESMRTSTEIVARPGHRITSRRLGVQPQAGLVFSAAGTRCAVEAA